VPQADLFTHDAGSYLAHIVQAKQAVTIPVIASLNGYYAGGWVEYAQLIEESGADGLELNVYYLETKGAVSGMELEQMYLDLVARIKASVEIPVAIKLSPYFTGMAHFLSQLDETAVDGMVLFNRFYQPDIDLDSQTFVPSLSLSSQDELRLRLRWTALLADRLKADIAITGGVHTAEDVVKCLLAGGKVAMMATAVLEHGIDYLAQVLAGLNRWLDDHGYESVAAMNGRLSQKNITDASALERANYMRVLKSYPQQ
jgi:dihydroorotate dehydrogenase (fumarate)